MTLPARRRFRAPETDGTAFIDPPLSEAAKLIEQNKRSLAEFDTRSGLPAGYRLAARERMLLALAHSEGTFPQCDSTSKPLILAGHQPELFHPGVWFKYFVISSISQLVSGKAINLVIDNDIVRSSAIRVPAGTRQNPQIIEVPFDAPSDPIPWQDRTIVDPSIFNQFGTQVRRSFGLFLRDSIWKRGTVLDLLWPIAIDAHERARRDDHNRLLAMVKEMPPDAIDVVESLHKVDITRLGDCLTQARDGLEREFGLETSEYPLAWLGLGVPDNFRTFAELILARHREFHAIHNRALAEYRLLNHVRSQSHPVTDLVRDNEWFEVPFWIWSAHNPRRKRAFVREVGTKWEVTDREGIVLQASEKDWLRINTGHDLKYKQIRFRPRALVTTMYARLVLSDLFIHGIGGAKYDEVTDEIIRRFFGIEPPKYITATATFRLPIERPQVTIEDVREARQKLRDVRYRPENLLRDPLTKIVAGLREQLQALADEKREYVRTHDLRRCEQQVFARLDTINRAMHSLLKPVEQELLAQHAQLQDDLRRADLLGSREFSFVLFPADDLPQRLLALSKVSA